MTERTEDAPDRPKLADTVEDALMRLIRRENLRPGDVLPSEREMMARLNVGRPAIREAMQRLRHMGLVQVRQGERPRMATPSIDRLARQTSQAMHHLLLNSAATLTHLKEARAAFEGMLAAEAALRATDVDIAALDGAIEAQVQAETDAARFRAADGAFHAILAAISGNPIYATLARAIFDWLSEFHADQVSIPGLEHLTIAEHRAILAKIAAGDAPAARDAMIAHIARANSLYRKAHATRDPMADA